MGQSSTTMTYPEFTPCSQEREIKTQEDKRKYAFDLRNEPSLPFLLEGHGSHHQNPVAAAQLMVDAGNRKGRGKKNRNKQCGGEEAACISFLRWD